MIKSLGLILLATCYFGKRALANLQTPTKVKLVFIEALDPKDTTSSQRFQQEYESAIAKGKELTAQRLSSCGFEISPTASFYGASDPIQAREHAEKSTKEGAWMIVGPRRSNHYLLLAKGAPNVPSVSLMASSDEVSTLGSLHLSLAPPNSAMAHTAAEEAAIRINPKSSKAYVSIVSADCLSCKDFAKHFDVRATSLGLKKSGEISIVGDAPNMAPIIAELSKYKPSFVLLPNYSIVTSHLISAIHLALPNAFFVGGDGWGNSRFGFVQNREDIGSTAGFTVRGNPSIDASLKTFSIGKEILKAGPADTYGSSSAIAILRVFDSTAQLLCDSKPENSTEFVAGFKKVGRKLYSAPWGTSIYNLENGNISFLKTSRGL
ncbi:MAG: hypothetical protein WCI18_02935 [Pseudomonadota bacterium]